MYRMLAAATLIGVCVVWNCGLGYAHHSVAANFDQSKSLEVTGKVKEFAIRASPDRSSGQTSRRG
jgi:hypothetical protein